MELYKTMEISKTPNKFFAKLLTNSAIESTGKQLHQSLIANLSV